MSAAAIEANSAAADAAREAREEAQKAAPPAPSQGKPAGRAAKGKAEWLTFDAVCWLTDFNSIEFGFYKNSRNRAKSRQFTTDMDIIGEITENGERTGVFGYREELWKKAATSMDKRLVVKLFTGDLSWRATMDLMIGRSLQHTVGAHGMPIMCYSINTNDDDYMIYLDRYAPSYPWQTEAFSFFILHEGRPVFYRLRRNYFTVTGSYTLYNERNQEVGTLTGRLFTIAGHWRGRVKAGEFDKRLLAVMKLFVSVILFNRGARRHMKMLYADLTSGKLQPKLETQEHDLYRNPRRMR